MAHTPTGKGKYEETMTKGKAEVKEGVANLRGHAGGGVDSNAIRGVQRAPKDTGTQGAEGEGKTGKVDTADTIPEADPRVRPGEPQSLRPATATVDAVTPSASGNQVDRKEGVKEEELAVPGAYQPSSTGGPQSVPEQGPQPQSTTTNPTVQHGDTSNSTPAQSHTDDKRLPERSRGPIFAGPEGKRVEPELSEDGEFAKEKPGPVKKGQIFMGSQVSTKVTGAEGAESASVQSKESSEGKAVGQTSEGP